MTHDRLTLDDLPDDPDAHPGDPGREWHPSKPEAYDDDGNLRDLSDDEVDEHLQKPEGEEQPDGFGRRRRGHVPPLAAEDSQESPDGEV